MKEKKSELALKKNFFKEKTSLEKFEDKIKQSIFIVLFVLLKHEDFDFPMEMISLLSELFQFMYYPFNQNYAYLWKKTNLHNGLQSFLGYFTFLVFFQNNLQMYIVTFYILILLVILVIADIFYVSIIFSQNKVGSVLALHLLRSVVSYIVTVLFMPIVEFFVAVLECTNLDNEGNPVGYYYNSSLPELRCWEGAHYIHATFAILISIIFCIICAVVQTIFYETKTNKKAQNAKTNSKADLFSLVVKILCIIMYSFLVRYQNLHWVIIIVTFILSLLLFYIYWTEKPFYDHRVMKGFLIFSGIYLWNTTVLLLAKILEKSEFDGCIELFIAGIPIVVVIIITMKNNNFSVLLANINKVEKGEIIIKQVRYFLELVDNDKDRRSKILLKGYINLHNESCPLEDCALKKFIASHSITNPDGIISYLYLHAQSMYQAGISKFPNCTSLRMAYSFFLMERLNNKKLSLLQLKTAERYEPNFEEQFLIYNFKKIIEERENDGDDEDEEGEMDVVSNIAYRNHYLQFKSAISNAASLYTDFWNLLLIPNQDTQEDLTKMNELGSRINQAVEVITTNFDMMQKYKSIDEEALRMYTEFLTEILNDKEKAGIYKIKLSEIEKDKNLNVEIQNVNFDLKNLPTNDEFQYIILSAEPNHLGLITKISTGICSIFGYTKNEIIGKNVETIMPELYHKHHRNILQNTINEYKKNFGKTVSKKPTFREISVLCRNRSKYLILLDMKVSLMANQDQSEIYFIAKVNPDSNLQNLNSKKGINFCYLLTNKRFIVQNFTANSINILGLQSSSMGTMDISKMIKDFTDDNLEGEEKENTQKNKYEIINKYKVPTTVTWRTLILDKSQVEIRRKTLKETSKIISANSIFNKTPIMRNRYKEESFTMTASESKIAGHTVGFIFKFESIKTKNWNFSSSSDTYQPFKSVETTETVQLNRFSSRYDFGNRNNLNFTSRDSMRYGQNKNNTPIDFDFFPSNPVTFYFDQKEMSYVTNANQISNTKNNLKDQAEKKLEKFKIIKDEENKDNDNSLVSYTLQSEKSDLTSNNVSSENSESISGKENTNLDESNVNNENSISNQEYYNVDMSSIVFLIYDHKKNSLVEIKDRNRQSQVEFKKFEDSKKIEKLSLLKKQTEKKKKEAVLNNEDNFIEEKNSINNESILLKQIEYALAKEESEPEIIKLKSISFFMFVIIILIAILYFIYFLSCNHELSKTIDLIEYSYKLISNSLIGVYLTRELLLVNNPSYANHIFDSKEEYKKNITDSLLNIFTETHSIQTNMIKSAAFLSNSIKKKDRTNYNNEIWIKVTEESQTTRAVALSIQTAYSEANTFLYDIIIMSSDEMSSTNKSVYFYIYNWLNSILMTSQSNSFAYVGEIDHLKTNIKNQLNYILISFCLISVIIFFFIRKAYNSVIIRKESYLEVFFEIGIDVIKRAIEKCDKFTKKFSSEESSNADSTRFDEDTNEEDSKENNKNAGNNNSNSNEKKRKVRGAETKIVIIKILLFLLMFTGFFVFINIYYARYLTTFTGYCSFYNITAFEENYYLLTFNTLREYIFDKNSFVSNITISENIEDVLKNNYDWKWKREIFAERYYDSLPESFLDFYNNITYSNICNQAGDLFSNKTITTKIECQDFSHNSISYGLEILLTDYIEELRTLKFKYDKIYFESSNPNKENEVYSSNSDLTEDGDNPMRIFNDKLFFDLGLINVFVIKNSYDQTLTYLKLTLDGSLRNFRFLFILLFVLFLLTTLYCYFFLWRPFENHLNQTIYKTKNMLSIIPKEVLASLSNINKLLDISSYSFSNVNKKKNNHSN